MSTFLRRALPTLLVAAALVLVFSGVLAGAGDLVVPSALMLMITAGSAVLYRNVARARRAATVRPAARTVTALVTSVPTQRSAPRCVIPAQRAAPGAGLVGGAPGGAAVRWNAGRAGGAARGGVRHCVVPRGELPHQRKAPDES